MCSLMWQSREGLKAEVDTAGIVIVLQQALRNGETGEDTGSEGRWMEALALLTLKANKKQKALSTPLLPSQGPTELTHFSGLISV